MTNPHDPVTGDTQEHVVNEQPVEPAPAGSQVNVNTGGPTHVQETTTLAYVRRVLWVLFGILVALIGLRILLLALGANEGNAIVDSIYAVTEPFVAPFRGVFSMETVRPTGSSIIDVAAIVALVGWSLIALLVTALLRIPDRA